MNANRERMAREAFWGSRPVLMAMVLTKLGYEMDDTFHAANGVTLAECIKVVWRMSDEEIAEAEALS